MGTGQLQFDRDGSFRVVQLSMTEVACTGDAAAVETRVRAQLEHSLFWMVEDDQLTLYPSDISDTGMILRAS